MDEINSARSPHQAERIVILGIGVEVSRSTDRKVKSNASHSSFHSPDRRGRPALARESLHPYGRQYQVDLERSRGHLRGAVAPRYVWTISFSLAYSRWLISEPT